MKAQISAKWLVLPLLLLIGWLPIGCEAEKVSSSPLSGTVFFDDGRTLDFYEMTGLIFSLNEGAESIPQNVSEWPVFFDDSSVSRSIPLSWVRSIEVVGFETKGMYRCLFNPVVTVESVTGVKFGAEYKTLEWIKVRVSGTTKPEITEKYIYFADVGEYLVSLHEAKINIRKIVFNNMK